MKTSSVVSYTASVKEDCEWLYMAKINFFIANTSPEKRIFPKSVFLFFGYHLIPIYITFSDVLNFILTSDHPVF